MWSKKDSKNVAPTQGVIGLSELAGQIPSTFEDARIRRAFVRKVSGILMVQLMITFTIVALFTFFEPLKKFVKDHLWMYITSYVVFLVTYLVLVCSRQAARSVPWNFVGLGVLTLAMSYMLGCLAAFHSSESVMIALGITLAVWVVLVAFSIQTKYDLTKKLVGFTIVGVTVLIMMAIFMIIFRSRILQVVYATIGALLFSGFLMMDVQLIIGGRKYEISPEEYIFGALMIYMDVVNLFIMFMALFGGGGGGGE